MALFNCAECSKPISTEAKSCPHCGAKVRPPKKPLSRFMQIFLLTLGVGLVLSVVWRQLARDEANQEKAQAEAQRVAAMTPEQHEKMKADKAKRDTQLQLAGAGAVRLKRAMKDPEAFELQSLVVKPNGTACYEYRAKNSFGASLPGNAVLMANGKMYTHDREEDAFVKYWNRDCTPAGGDEIAALVKRMGVL